MTNQRIPYYAALGVCGFLGLIALWLIVTSPGEIADVGEFTTPAPGSGQGIAVTVQAGQSPSDIGDTLEQLGVIESGTQFQVLVSLMGVDGLLQAGEYEFRRNMPAVEVVYRMRNGITATRTVTVIDGWRIEEIADAVEAQGIPRDEFISAAGRLDYDFDFVREIPQGQDLEGYLYPATYTVRSTDTGQSMVQKMLEAFDLNVPVDGIKEQAQRYNLTLHEVVTIASVIQREAVVAEEKPVMSQVFLSRIRSGVGLEADPTVQYAVSEIPGSIRDHGYWKAPLTNDDLNYDSLYNTYLYIGIPPGPIASPDTESIIAVVQPAATNYLYFVARPDGTHAFAETFEQHLLNIEAIESGNTSP